MTATQPSRPSRLHHHAYVSADLEATRAFYEDVVGLPLVATWCEAGGDASAGSDYCHAFFELGDGSALAFFQFADADARTAFTPAPSSPFDHIALAAEPEVQDEIRTRAEAAGVGHLTIDHGYCTSLYLSDPDGLIVELTVDLPAAVTAEAVAARRRDAHAALARWLAGDHADTNPYRPH